MWSRPALSRNAIVTVSVVTPSASFSSSVSSAHASGQPSNSHVWTIRVGGSISRYVPRNEHSFPSGVTKTMWYSLPTRRSIEHTVSLSSKGANQWRTCSGFVSTSKTSSIGASNSRVVTITSSLGYSTTADPWRLGVTGGLLAALLLKLFEVGIHPIQPLVQRPLVLGQPIAKRLQVRRFQPVQPVTSLCPAPD